MPVCIREVLANISLTIVLVACTAIAAGADPPSPQQLVQTGQVLDSGSENATCLVWNGSNDLFVAGLNGVVRHFSRTHGKWSAHQDYKDYMRQQSIEMGTGAIFTLSVSPDQKLLATAGFDRKARLWPLDPARSIPLDGQNSKPIRALAVSGPLVAAAAGSMVYHWPTKGTGFANTPQISALTVPDSIDWVASLTWLGSNDAIAAVLGNGNLAYLPTASGAVARLIEPPQERAALPVLIDDCPPMPSDAPSETALATSIDLQGVVRHWNLAACPPKFVNTLPNNADNFALGTADPALGFQLADVAGKGFSIWRGLKVAGGRIPVDKLMDVPDATVGDKIAALAFSQDGCWFALAGTKQSALFKVAAPSLPPMGGPSPDNPPVLPIDPAKLEVNSLAVSAKARCMAIAVASPATQTGDKSYELYVLNLTAGSSAEWKLCTWPGANAPLEQLQFVGGISQWLVGRSGNRLLIWNATNPDECHLAARPFIVDGVVTAYTISDDQRLLLIGTANGVIYGYKLPPLDAKNLRGFCQPPIHFAWITGGGAIRSLSYYADSQRPRVVSVSDDGKGGVARVWDAGLDLEPNDSCARQLQVFTLSAPDGVQGGANGNDSRLLNNGTTLLTVTPHGATVRELASLSVERLAIPNDHPLAAIEVVGCGIKNVNTNAATKEPAPTVLFASQTACSFWTTGGDPTSGSPVQPMLLGQDTGQVGAAAFVEGSAGRQIVTASSDKYARFWNDVDKRFCGKVPLPDEVAVFSPTSDGVIALLKNGSYQLLWSTDDNDDPVHIQMLTGPSATPPAAPLAVVRDDGLLMAGGLNATVLMSSLGPGQVFGGQPVVLSRSGEPGSGGSPAPAAPLPDHQRHRGPIYSLNFDPTGRLLATTGADGLIRVWRCVASSERRDNFFFFAHCCAERRFLDLMDDDPFASAAYGVVFLSGSRLASIGADGEVVFWDLSGSNARGQHFPAADPAATATSVTDAALAFAVNPNRTRLAVGRRSGTVSLYDAVTPRLLDSIFGPQAGQQGEQVQSQTPEPIISLAFCPASPTGQPVLALVTQVGTLKIVETSTCLASSEQLSLHFNAVVSGPDGQLAAAGRDGKVYFFDVSHIRSQ